MVRPRGLHLPEKHFLFNGKPIPGCLLDFGLYFFHNAKELLERGSGPYFYLPKMQDHLEARCAANAYLAPLSGPGKHKTKEKVVQQGFSWLEAGEFMYSRRQSLLYTRIGCSAQAR